MVAVPKSRIGSCPAISANQFPQPFRLHKTLVVRPNLNIFSSVPSDLAGKTDSVPALGSIALARKSGPSRP